MTINKNIFRHQTANRWSLFTVLTLLCLTIFAQKTKEITILHTNDVHSRIEPTGKNLNSELTDKGGFIRRATYINEERQIDSKLLLFDCGDFSQGTPYYNLFKGELEIKLMNAMKYDAATIGNHEFDFGLENMYNLFKLADFPIVCANYDFKGTILESLVKPYVVLKRYGLKIGVFGLSPQLNGLVQEKNFHGITYLEPNAVANKIAAHLKKKEKCAIVICLSHLGWQVSPKHSACDEDLIANTRNIDLILGGHTHSLFEKVLFYKNLDGKEVPLNQVGGMGIYIGKIIMKLAKE